MPPTGNKVVGALADANAVMEGVNQLLTTFVPMGGLIVGLAKVVRAIAVKNGIDVKPFDEEIAKVDTALTNLHAATDEFRAKFGFAPPQASIPTGENPAGPPPGD